MPFGSSAVGGLTCDLRDPSTLLYYRHGRPRLSERDTQIGMDRSLALLRNGPAIYGAIRLDAPHGRFR